MLGMFLGGAATQLIGALTAPKRPKTAPYRPLEQDINDYMPNADELRGVQSDMALSMMRGEIPDSVKDQVSMAVGERAQRGGYGSTGSRVANMEARDLGLMSLDIMRQGSELSSRLLADAGNRMIGDANRHYDAWASKAQIQMAEYRDKAATHAGYVSAATSMVGQAFTANSNQKTEDRYYDMIDSVYGAPASSKASRSGYQPAPRMDLLGVGGAGASYTKPY